MQNSRNDRGSVARQVGAQGNAREGGAGVPQEQSSTTAQRKLLQQQATWLGPPSELPPEFAEADSQRWHIGAL